MIPIDPTDPAQQTVADILSVLKPTKQGLLASIIRLKAMVWGATTSKSAADILAGTNARGLTPQQVLDTIGGGTSGLTAGRLFRVAALARQTLAQIDADPGEIQPAGVSVTINADDSVTLAAI